MNQENHPQFERATVNLPAGLLAQVEQHRTRLATQTGIGHLSRSATVAQLLRAGLAAQTDNLKESP